MSHANGSFLSENEPNVRCLIPEGSRGAEETVYISPSSANSRNVYIKKQPVLAICTKVLLKCFDCLGDSQQKRSMNRVADVKLYCTCDYYPGMMIHTFFSLFKRGLSKLSKLKDHIKGT